MLYVKEVIANSVSRSTRNLMSTWSTNVTRHKCIAIASYSLSRPEENLKFGKLLLRCFLGNL